MIMPTAGNTVCSVIFLSYLISFSLQSLLFFDSSPWSVKMCMTQQNNDSHDVSAQLSHFNTFWKTSKPATCQGFGKSSDSFSLQVCFSLLIYIINNLALVQKVFNHSFSDSLEANVGKSITQTADAQHLQSRKMPVGAAIILINSEKMVLNSILTDKLHLILMFNNEQCPNLFIKKQGKLFKTNRILNDPCDLCHVEFAQLYCCLQQIREDDCYEQGQIKMIKTLATDMLLYLCMTLQTNRQFLSSGVLTMDIYENQKLLILQSKCCLHRCPRQ